MSQSDGSAEIAYVGSSFSNTTHCVEAGADPQTDRIAVRHSKRPDVAPLMFTRSEWEAFLQGAAAGEFDIPKLVAKLTE